MNRPSIYWFVATAGVALAVAGTLLRAGHQRPALAAIAVGLLAFAGGVSMALRRGGSRPD